MARVRVAHTLGVFSPFVSGDSSLDCPPLDGTVSELPPFGMYEFVPLDDLDFLERFSRKFELVDAESNLKFIVGIPRIFQRKLRVSLQIKI